MAPHGGLERGADILGNLPHLAPMGVSGDLKPVVFRVGGELGVAAGFFQGDLRLFVEDIAEALVE